MSTVSLVTGGNRGIGREVCRQLVAHGHTVILTARSAEDAASAARPIGADPVQLDVTNAESVAAARREVEARYGHLDVLVNNAAILYDTWQRAATADLAVVREAAETNLYGGDRHGGPRRPAGRGRRGQRGLGGDLAGLGPDGRLLPRRQAAALVTQGEP